MKIAALSGAMLMLLAGGAGAEVAERALVEANPAPIYEFAREYAPEMDAAEIAKNALKGETPGLEDVLTWLKRQAEQPIRQVLSAGRGILAPLLLTALVRCALPGIKGGGNGARFLLRLYLLLAFSQVAMLTLEAADDCLRAVGKFADAAAPGVAALLSAMGMTGSAALVTPAAALAGNIAENLFRDWGLLLCRCALSTAIAGNLSSALNLGRVTRLIKRAANWGAGLATTLFTALIALQGTVSAAADGVAARTAKYAVDSAAPVIGSGVSDAWESYVAGMLVAKNALGVSGLLALLAAGLKPVLICAAAMLIHGLAAALLDALGEREAARAAEQIGGICQMALSLLTGALAIGTVLLGAAMALGGRLI